MKCFLSNAQDSLGTQESCLIPDRKSSMKYHELLINTAKVEDTDGEESTNEAV